MTDITFTDVLAACEDDDERQAIANLIATGDEYGDLEATTNVADHD